MKRADEARQSAEAAKKLWNAIKQPGVLTAHREALRDVDATILNQPSPQ